MSAEGAPATAPADDQPSGSRGRRRRGRSGTGRRAPGTVRERTARRIVLSLLARIRSGELEVVEGPPWRTRTYRLLYGEPVPERPLRARLRVHSPNFYRQLLHGSLGASDSYAAGEWDCDDLVALTRIAARNVGAWDRARRLFAPVLEPLRRAARRLQRNTPGRSREHVAAHYDLGNELFELFLDEAMMYSCAVFPNQAATLDEASLAKLELVCAKLELGPGENVLEIGAGWGGFAIYAAREHGCRVTTTTISAEQHAYASERVREAGLADLVTVLREDYRELQGSYDKLVSIEMIEAVGWRDFPTFFRRCSELVGDGGAMLLQAIVIEDGAYEAEKAARSFINTHIFPGGCLPSMKVISRNLGRVTDFRVLDVEDLTSHYVTTLEHWRRRFLAAAERVTELGYDERFLRRWELYLAYCEGGFSERRIQDVQMLLAKPGWRATPGSLPAAPPTAGRPLPAPPARSGTSASG
jgi:cyclopropane-fatty-acyl-phospholipid synthase